MPKVQATVRLWMVEILHVLAWLVAALYQLLQMRLERWAAAFQKFYLKKCKHCATLSRASAQHLSMNGRLIMKGAHGPAVVVMRWMLLRGAACVVPTSAGLVSSIAVAALGPCAPIAGVTHGVSAGAQGATLSCVFNARPKADSSGFAVVAKNKTCKHCTTLLKASALATSTTGQPTVKAARCPAVTVMTWTLLSGAACVVTIFVLPAWNTALAALGMCAPIARKDNGAYPSVENARRLCVINARQQAATTGAAMIAKNKRCKH
jgi:hypothetical protein